ncbi:CLUMA_CG012950, isoform A [Clunio marinus]|uniref:CLUMA_CG012950, isoform A n=1 Tax=Clunio marinus TaxID=568069 RepID=A0A1J1IHA1_9DIPT|nr:CLUMA_CG012950, isoform A [Clunio marinus]
MAKKIPFSCIFSSDEDLPQYPASELNSHGPSVFGWRSKQDPNNEKAPKEIVLKFQFPAKIYKIQVLAHQFLIPERIEFWLHYSSKNATPSSQLFEYVGFISLSEASGNFQSREMQSIIIPQKLGTHLKLRMGNPYPNNLNPNNQLALIAVNVLGEEFNPNSNDLSHLKLKVPDDISEVALASITDDLGYCMYVEESIVEIVRKLEELKHKAVADERFEYARKLKCCMNCLRTAGERLGRYALSKRLSVLKEDFTTARLRKEQMEMYKKLLYEKLEIEKLLETRGLIVENDICSEAYITKPTLPQAPTLVEVANYLENSKSNGVPSTEVSPGLSNNAQFKYDEPIYSPKVRSSPKGSPNSGSLRRRNKSAPRNATYDYDEREIPTLRHSHTNEFLRECHHPEPESSRGRSKLNDREKRQASIPILVFGLDIVEMFYSRQFQDREEGLTQLREVLREKEKPPEFGYNKTTRGATLLLHRAVRDAVFSVFSAAAETIRCLFCEFMPGKVSHSEIARCVDKLLPELLSKSGDPSPRVHNLAQHTILSIAACDEVRDQHLIAPSISRPVTNGTHPRLALSRMQMLEQLVLSQGINNDKHSGMTCRILSECGWSGINHPHENVRKVAERILLAVYKINPRLIRKQLPPDDEITRRNLLYRQLFSEFDKIDLQRKREILNERKLDKMDFSVYASNHLSEESGESSKTKNHVTINSVKTLRINDRASPTTLPRQNHHNQIVKSASGHSIKSFDRRHEFKCTFCNTIVQSNHELDFHYWKICPFLTKCENCRDIVKVADLNSHLLSECTKKSDYNKCDVCQDAVLNSDAEHKTQSHCRELSSGISKCSLCKENVYLPDDGGWERHFPIGCPQQKRKLKK